MQAVPAIAAVQKLDWRREGCKTHQLEHVAHLNLEFRVNALYNTSNQWISYLVLRARLSSSEQFQSISVTNNK